MATNDPVLAFAERVIGADHANLTFEERDARIKAKANSLGWNLEHLGADGWCLSKDNRFLLLNSIGDVVMELVRLGA